MPVIYKIDPTKKLIRTRCIGNVTLDEIADHFGELERDPARPDCLNVLLDVREATSLPLAEEVRAVSLHIEELRDKMRFGACAIVASNDAFFGMMRMFEVFAEESFVATRVFRQVEEAEAWLAPYEAKPRSGKASIREKAP